MSEISREEFVERQGFGKVYVSRSVWESFYDDIIRSNCVLLDREGWQKQMENVKWLEKCVEIARRSLGAEITRNTLLETKLKKVQEHIKKFPSTLYLASESKDKFKEACMWKADLVRLLEAEIC